MHDKSITEHPQVFRTDAINVTFPSPNLVQIETASGQKITIQGDASGVLIQDAGGASIQLQGGNIQIRASGKVSLACSEIEIDASTLTVNAGIAKFSGVVQAETLVANAVVANSYTPGAGNLW